MKLAKVVLASEQQRISLPGGYIYNLFMKVSVMVIQCIITELYGMN